ncbi:MAG: hypothetical protein EOM23_11420 [Candidatus Moranbacteria bacterium]|nr:hypothetical protein [Candidatus Moranbacteria bacterium]
MIKITQTEIYTEVNSDAICFTLIYKKTNWIIKHEHIGIAQFGCGELWQCKAWESFAERELFIKENGLVQYVSEELETEI